MFGQPNKGGLEMDEVIFEYNSVEVTPVGLVLINVNE